MPLVSVGLVGPRLLHRLGRFLCFVGEAAFAFGDPGQFLRVLFQRLDAAAFIDDFLAFVEQALQVHRVPLLGGVAPNLSAPTRRAGDQLHCHAMAIQGGQSERHLVTCASPAVVVVAVVGVVTEAELVIKSSVVV
ncbi:MAG: hypothetical protein JSS97_13540 [Actinobacteria bacterium]|nr:hypothetical protein [Actinomycetota bacterium]